MPAAIPLVAAGFIAAGTVATAVGLGTLAVVAGLSITWAAALTVTGVALMAVSYLARKTPKPDSRGQQLQQKLDPQAPVPIVYGRTASGGTIVNRGTYGSKNKFYYAVTVHSIGLIAGVEAARAGDLQLAFGGNPATGLASVSSVGSYGGSSKLYKGKLRQRWMRGETPSATTPASSTGQPLPGGAMSGLAHTITICEYDTDAFPQGLPSSLHVLRGVHLYDPRRDSTFPGGSGAHRRDNPATWEFSENPYLAALDWTLGRHYNGRRVYGIGALWSEVDVQSFVNGANVADANNWKVGGQVTTSDDKYAVLASILAAGGGVPVARGAQIAVSVNAPKTSVLTITTEDLIDTVDESSSTGFRDRKNTIIPRYREESQNWEIVSGQRVSAAQYITEDEAVRSVEIEFPLVQQAAQAHQLATYELVNSREFITINARVKLRMMAARVGDAVQMVAPEVGINSRKFTVVGREFNPSDNTVTLSLKSETDSKHAFALGQSQVAPPSPALDGYDPSAPEAPAANAWSITDTQISNGSTILPVLVISGAADDPNTKNIIAEYRPTGSSDWIPAGEYPRTATKIEINSVTDGTAYDVAISYRTVRNVVGARLILSATAGALQVNYGKIEGTPTRLEDVNKDEGDKLGGIADGADVTGDNTSKDTGAVGGRPSGDIIGAITDRNGAFIRADKLQEDILALTETYGDTASAEAARIAAEAARDASQLAETNSKAARDAAQARAAEAAQSVSDASGFATSASGHATTATQKADAAGQFAQTAEAHVSTATTKAGEAKTYRDEAATSASNASGSAQTATQQAGLAAGSAGTASGHAQAASNSATTASTKATEAGNSATAANQSRIDAQAANGSAQGHASAASGSATTANESASAASASASQAAGFRDTASTHAQNASSSAATASADAASARDSRDLAAGYYNGIAGSPLAARLQTVETVTTNGTFAAASTVSSLSSTVGSLSSTVSNQAGTLTTVAGRVGAYWSVEAAAGGRARVRVNADGYGSLVDIAADQIYLGDMKTLAVENGRVTVTGDLHTGTGRIVMNNGSYMKVMGTGFGSANQFIEWFGPTQASISTCSEANATSYLKTNGQAYFGGSLSAGILRNSVTTTTQTINSNVQLGPFGSNGGQRTYVLSYNYSYYMSTYNGGSYSGTPTAQVQLRRDGPSGPIVTTLNVSGSGEGYPAQMGGQEPGYVSVYMGGSTTFVDNSGGTSITLYAQLVSRNEGNIGGDANIAPTINQAITILSTEG